MDEFLLFFDEKAKVFPMHLEIYYSKIMDWCVRVWKEGCKKDFPDAKFKGDDVILVSVQDSDCALCFAKAHVELKEWLRMHNGGY